MVLYMKKFFNKYKLTIFRGFFSLTKKYIVKIIKIISVTGYGTDFCLKEGVLPVRVHFHSPIPDLEDLDKRKIWDIKSKLRGIEFRKDDQISLIRELGQKYGNECRWPQNQTQNPLEFYTENSSFGGGCAAVAHSMIRNFKPDLVIEIGSGMSSLIINNALKLNESECGTKNNYIIIDPYPIEEAKKGLVGKRLIEKRVELLDPAFFEQLKENDVLFIDSGHSVRIGGDVNFLYLDVLPRLTYGVIVHVHDIRLPYEYSERLSKNEAFRQFWTEQYLLQSFLCFNSQFEILLAANYLMVDHTEEFLNAFPYCSLGDHPSSFWIRRKTMNNERIK
jgi:hypothetical protein